ncbi:MAG TPA: ATP-binding cassette domain-containing protein [Acidimicrobiales bacterium]|nr:ATP-binding cassette domain-containing protein [Acidimicrobiales bacterium]
MGRIRQSAEYRFLTLLTRVDPVLGGGWWLFIVVRAALPALFALAMGQLIGVVQGHHALGGPLVTVGVLFGLMEVLPPINATLSTNLAQKATTFLHDALLEASLAPAGIAHLERPEINDRLIQARDFDLGVAGPPMSACLPRIADGFVEIGGGISLALVLFGYRWWAPFLASFGWVWTHRLLRKSSVWKAWEDPTVAEELRHVNYAYDLAVRAPAAKEIRMFGLADWTVDRYFSRRKKMVELIIKARSLHKTPIVVAITAIAGGNVVLFWALAHDAAHGRIGIRAVTVFAQAALGTSALAFGEVDWWFRQGSQPVPVVLDLVADLKATATVPRNGTIAATAPRDAIVFDNVTFAYRDGPKIFDGLSLRIPAGKSIAVVGQNGAGKTTLAKLLCRLYDPVDGAIRVDGTDLRALDLDSWRRQLAAVFQDYVKYELPLADNVAPTGGDRDTIAAALHDAGADQLADLDTILNRGYADGTDLSGGQWQRVALARALYAVRTGAEVVLLDEPTAQLDVRGEAEIFDRILQATKGKTTILVSHRFATVRHADLICVLEHGKVIELGTHAELMARGGRYRTMFDLQAARFEEEGFTGDPEGEDADAEVSA